MFFRYFCENFVIKAPRLITVEPTIAIIKKIASGIGIIAGMNAAHIHVMHAMGTINSNGSRSVSSGWINVEKNPFTLPHGTIP